MALPSTKGGHDGGGEAGAPVFGERHVARCRQPAEFDREQEDQHDPEPEIRRRDAPQREQVGAVVPRRAFLHRRDDAGGNADQERDHDRHRPSWIVTGSFCAISSRTGTLMRKRLAEVAGQHALDPVKILHRDRTIEPVLLANLAITAGSRSSPAITSAGSPGNRCCREKIRIDTKNSVGINCSDALGEETQHGSTFPGRSAARQTLKVLRHIGFHLRLAGVDRERGNTTGVSGVTTAPPKRAAPQSGRE